MRATQRLLCFLTLMSAMGCSLWEGSSPPRRYHLFEIEASESPNALGDLKAPSTLMVRPLVAAPPYNQKRFIFLHHQHGLQPDARNEFIASPGDLFTQQTRRRLAGSGCCGLVLGEGSYLSGDFILEGALNLLRGRIEESGELVAEIEVRFYLADNRQTPPTAMFQKSYRRRIGVTEIDSDALMRGWNRAAQQALDELEVDLRQAIGGAIQKER